MILLHMTILRMKISLIDTAEHIEAVLEECREWDIEDAADFPVLIEERKPRYDRLIHLAQYFKAVLKQRMERDSEVEVLEDRNGDGNSQLQSTFPSHHDFDNVVVTTSPPDILSPDPLPLSPNIQSIPPHHLSAFLITALQR